MKLGEINKRIELQHVTAVADEYGQGAEQTWTTYATRWAGVETLGSNESVVAQQVTAIASHKFTLRYLPGVLHTDRIKWGNRIFNIASIKNYDEANEVLEIMTKEVQ